MLKRPEVWLLIVLAGAGSIWFAFFQEPAPELPITPVAESTQVVEVPQTQLELLDSRAEDSGDHWVIELTVRVENPTATEQTLAAPFIQLSEPDGSQISEFYLPFAKPTPIAPQETVSGQLRYFLPKSIQSVELRLHDQRLPLTVSETTGKIEPQ